MAANRTRKRRLSVRVIVVTPRICSGIRDADRPVRRRQPMTAWRASAEGVAWVKAVPGECRTCEGRRKASFEDAEGYAARME